MKPDLTREPLDRRIWSDLLDCLPEDWTRGRLKVVRQEGPGDRQGFAAEIEGPGPGPAIPSSTLLSAVRELDLFLQEKGHAWATMVYSVEFREEAGRWRTEAEFTYRDSPVQGSRRKAAARKSTKRGQRGP